MHPGGSIRVRSALLGSPARPASPAAPADRMQNSPAHQMHQLPFSEQEDSTEDKQNKNKGRAELY